MKRVMLVSPLFMLMLCPLVANDAHAQEERSPVYRYRIHTRGEYIMRGTSEFPVRAIEGQAIGDPRVDHDAKIMLMHKIAECGGSAICFDVRGYSEDGKTLSAEVSKAILDLMPDLQGRSLIAVIRVLPKDAPADKAFRENAVKAAAEAFKEERRALFLIEGDDAKSLCRAFSKVHPQAAIAATDGGHITLVTEWQQNYKGNPRILLGSVPPEPWDDKSNFLMAGGDDVYAKVDEALMFPEEKQPWTPDNSMLTEQERAEGWVSLFDGKTLNGWFIMGRNKNGFAAEDGMIVWKARGGSSLRTVKRFGDFHLKCEWKIVKGGNNGLHLRAPRAGRSSRIGMEYQMMGDYGVEPNKNSTGSVYDVEAPRVAANKPEGEWNETEIILDGSHLVYKLNGQVVQDLDMDAHPELKYRLRRGFIAITDHGHPTWFRNFKIKEL